ncbi:hypothetical protein POX_c03723 [Penicillium oxalicum]|uniref:hypothetical protein n=1 Tax=Penicillium oxalicum TaxID=69781 RepID=UPI0020B8E541|nr:hypothetical protein POX_c03723 [Penicillium oxalicum]KAI2790872.1 hypothetical protein POX_c03723 [Penicillium oxalicum]
MDEYRTLPPEFRRNRAVGVEEIRQPWHGDILQQSRRRESDQWSKNHLENNTYEGAETLDSGGTHSDTPIVTDWTYECKDSGLRLTVLRVFVLFAVRHGQPHRRPEGHRAKSARHCGLGMHQESLKPPWSTLNHVRSTAYQIMSIPIPEPVRYILKEAQPVRPMEGTPG